ADRAAQVPGATRLDGAGGRLWLLDTEGRIELPAGNPKVRCLVAPRLKLPAELVASRLRGGDVRVVAPGAPATAGLVARLAGVEAP
ncbi:hypothetical protein, partial [Salmonella enterica]|uniref:hypothetical protein n=1 Tax=Salmonella enterica TaxID=28901 RepID=UPI0032968119